MSSPICDAGFIFFLPAQEKQSQCVLNFDESEGLSSIVLSYYYDSVVCQCSDIASSLVVEERVASRGITNVSIVVADVSELPYDDHSFSLIIFPRLWQGTCTRYRFNRLLNEIWRVLDEPGQVYFGAQFCGAIHRQLTQKLLLLLNLLLSKTIRSSRLLTLIFHYLSLEELHFVKGIVGADLLQIDSLCFLLKRVFAGDNIGFIWGRGHYFNRSTIIGRIVDHIEKKAGCKFGDMGCARIGSGGSLIADFDNYIIRVPFGRDAIFAAEKNYAALEFLNEKPLPFFMPVPVMRCEVGGLHIFCETKIKGISLDLDKNSQLDDEWLIECSLEMLTDHSLIVGRVEHSDELISIVDEPFQQVTQSMSEAEQLVSFQVIAQIKNVLAVLRVPLVVRHGDFKKSNFIINEKSHEIGLIDWETMSIPGLPFCDLLRFINHEINGWYDNDDNLIPRVWQLINSGKRHILIDRYFDLLGMSLLLLPTLTMVFFIYHINDYCRVHSRESVLFRQKIIKQKLMPVMNDYLKLEQRAFLLGFTSGDVS